MAKHFVARLCIMKLQSTLFQKGLFTLLTAPVAKGKTYAFTEFYQNHQMRVVFVSPLRALAAEIYEKFSSEKNVFWPGDKQDKASSRTDQYINFLAKKKALLILTVELLEDEFLDIIAAEGEPILFVFDEFHLFYIWGDHFRPVLHDKFLGVLNTEHPVLALSATMNDVVLNNLISDLQYYANEWIHLNFGNLELYRTPNKINIFKGHDKNTLERAFWREMKMKKAGEVLLMFCSYRGEVDEMVEMASRHGFIAIGCVGGEVERFQTELKTHSGNIDCIVSTIALSHGVNLPEIKKVFINYEVKNYDFWLQMVGRGGRRGSGYEVYCFDTFHLEKKEKWLQFLKVGISDWIGREI